MPIRRRTGGAPRWLFLYVSVCLAALLLSATALYLTTAQVAVALQRLVIEGSRPRPVHDIPYADLINRAAAGQGLNPALVAAVVSVESGFNAHARSGRGASGLMQVMPATWRELRFPSGCSAAAARGEEACIDDPQANLTAGAAYLRRLIDRFKGNLPYALAAYNAGANSVEQHEGVPPYPETAGYLRQVALAWLHLQRDGTLTPFWRALTRSANVPRYAHRAMQISTAALGLPLLWLLQRLQRPALRFARQALP
jgi:hypothetical protein